MRMLAVWLAPVRSGCGVWVLGGLVYPRPARQSPGGHVGCLAGPVPGWRDDRFRVPGLAAADGDLELVGGLVAAAHHRPATRSAGEGGGPSAGTGFAEPIRCSGLAGSTRMPDSEWPFTSIRPAAGEAGVAPCLGRVRPGAHRHTFPVLFEPPAAAFRVQNGVGVPGPALNPGLGLTPAERIPGGKKNAKVCASSRVLGRLADRHARLRMGHPKPDHRPPGRAHQHVRAIQPCHARLLGQRPGLSIQCQRPSRIGVRGQPGHGISGPREQHRGCFTIRRRLHRAESLSSSVTARP